MPAAGKLGEATGSVPPSAGLADQLSSAQTSVSRRGLLGVPDTSQPACGPLTVRFTCPPGFPVTDTPAQGAALLWLLVAVETEANVTPCFISRASTLVTLL